MSNRGPTREQLIVELEELRQRIADLETHVARSRQAEADDRPIDDGLQILAATAGTDGYRQKVNAVFERILGWTEQQPLSRPSRDFIHPDDLAAQSERFEWLKSGEAAMLGEWRRLFDVLETLPVMICLLTPDYHVAFANRSFREKFGESNGRHCYEYCFGRTEPCEWCESYKVLRTGRPHEWEVAGPDGSIIAVYDFPFTDSDGSPMILEMDIDITEQRKTVAELARHRQHLEELVKQRTARLEAANVQLRAEISERKRAEDALRESEGRLVFALEVNQTGAWELDLSDHTAKRSLQHDRIFGYQSRLPLWTYEMFLAHVLPEYRDFVDHRFRQAMDTRGDWSFECPIRRDDGQIRWIRAVGRHRFDKNWNSRCMAGIVQDITDRKRAEETIRANEAKYRALIDSCPDAVIMIDLQGHIVFASERAAAQYGAADPNEFIGRQAVDFVVEGQRERFRASIATLIEEGVHRNVEYTLLRKDGTTFDAEMSSAVMRDADGKPAALMAVYRDVTERKRADEKLRANEAKLLAAAEIQTFLLPQDSPRIPGFDIAGRCYPAEVAAGDDFDYLWLPDGSLLVVLGDVSGHGIGPAIVAADFCARLRTLSESLCDLPEIAARVNAGLANETAGQVYVTAILGRLDPKARSLIGLNAGHPAAVVLNAAGQIKARLSTGGLPFAILSDSRFVAEDPVKLADGDLVFFYTDGLVEVHRQGKPVFGFDRAIEIVRANQQRPAAEIIEALYRSACQYAGADRPADDITVVIVKVLEAVPDPPLIDDRLDRSEAMPSTSECASDGKDTLNTRSVQRLVDSRSCRP